MISETSKKPNAFKIGVFTVFLVVMFITMLKSVVDSSPILFVKIAQNSVGAFDITLRNNHGGFLAQQGNMNYYGLDPFDGPFAYNATIPEKEQVCGNQTIPTTGDVLRTCPDNVALVRKSGGGTVKKFEFMRSIYYQLRLYKLKQFDGFVPRWYVPSTEVLPLENPEMSATQTLAIINTQYEIEVGVGYDW